jgi:hypothetical protein
MMAAAMADYIACGAATPNPHGAASFQHHGRRSYASVLWNQRWGQVIGGVLPKQIQSIFYTQQSTAEMADCFACGAATPRCRQAAAAAELPPPPPSCPPLENCRCRRYAAAAAAAAVLPPGCRLRRAATKLLPPPSCRRCRQAARHYRTTATAATLPLQPPWQCCRCRRTSGATAAAALPPSCCRRAPTTVIKLPATAELPLPPLRSHYRRCCRRHAALPPCFPKRCRRQ